MRVCFTSCALSVQGINAVMEDIKDVIAANGKWFFKTFLDISRYRHSENM